MSSALGLSLLFTLCTASCCALPCPICLAMTLRMATSNAQSMNQLSSKRDVSWCQGGMSAAAVGKVSAAD